MKKQLTVTLILTVLALFIPFLPSSLEMLLLFGIVAIIIALIIALIIIIFEIMMLIRLNNAKNASPHPNLVRTFQFFIANIIIGVVLVFNNNFIIGFALELARPIVILIAWKFLTDYIKIYEKETPASPGFQLVAQGFKMYTISVFLSLGIQVVSFFMSFTFDFGRAIVLMIISSIIAIFSIVASYKLANGIMRVFGGSIPSGPPSGPPSSSHSMYGAPTPQFTSHLPDNSSQYGTPDSEPATTIQTTNAKQNFCPQCGGIVDPEAKFCGVCGYTISK